MSYLQTFVEQMWVSWKSAPWDLYFTSGRQWLYIRASQIYCPFWM